MMVSLRLLAAQAAPVAAEKSSVETIVAQVGAVRGAIVDLVVIFAFIFFARAVIAEIRSDSTIIDPIEVPKDLAEQGYTPQVIAQRLHSEIAALATSTRTALEEGFEVGGSQIDFAVPSAGVSFRNIVRYVRQQIGRPEPRLRGEIVRENETSANAVPKSNIRILLRTSDGRTAQSAISVTGTAAIPELLRSAAFAAADLADPFVLCVYWFDKEKSTGDFPKTMEAVRRCLSSTPIGKHHRAYHIWGDVLGVQRRYVEAEEKYRRAIALAPRKSRGYLGLGNLFRSMRRYDEAFAQYAKAAAFNRKDPAPLSSLGYICNDRHQYADAVNYFHAALQLNPRHVGSLNGLGFSYWKLNRPGDARAALNRAIDIDPRYGWPYRNLALMLRAERRYDEAIQYLKAAVEVTTIAAEALALWGDILVDRGDFDGAVATYQRSEEADRTLAARLGGEAFRLTRQHQFEEALRASDEALKRDQYFLNAWLSGTEALRRIGRFEDAIARSKKILERDPYATTAYVQWGICIQAHSLDQALALYERATVIDPSDTWAWRSWADALRKRHHYKDAIAKYKKALASDPFDSYAHYGWGQILWFMGRADEADEHFRTAHQLDGRNAAAVRALTEIDLRAGRIVEARARFENAISDWPRWAPLHVEQGQMLLRLGFLVDALASFDHALSLDPRDPDALTGKANVLRRLRRFDDAMPVLMLATAVEPTHNAARLALVNTLRDCGETERAWETLEAARGRQPFDSGVLVEWGNLLSKERRYAEAEEKYQQAISLDRYDIRARIELGNALLRRHQPVEATRVFRAAAAINRSDPEPLWGIGRSYEMRYKYKRAIDCYRTASPRRPNESYSYIAWAAALQRMGLLGDALDRLRRAREVDRSNTGAFDLLLGALTSQEARNEALQEIACATTEPALPQFLSAAGHALRRMKRMRESRAMYRKALRLTPVDAGTWIGFAETIPARHVSWACKILEPLLTSDPSNGWARSSLAWRRWSQGQPEEALDLFARSYEQYPDNPQPLLDASVILMFRAREAGREAIEAREAQDDVRAAAREQDRDDFYARAEEKLRLAVEHHADDADTHRRLGEFLRTVAKPREALEQFDRCIRLNPYDWSAHLGRASALFEMNERRKAIQAARRAAKVRRQDVFALTEIAHGLSEVDEPAEALAILNTASAIGPMNERATKLRDELNEKLYRGDSRETA